MPDTKSRRDASDITSRFEQKGDNPSRASFEKLTNTKTGESRLSRTAYLCSLWEESKTTPRSSVLKQLFSNAGMSPHQQFSLQKTSRQPGCRLPEDPLKNAFPLRPRQTPSKPHIPSLCFNPPKKRLPDNKAIKELKQDPAFAYFLDMPWVFTYFAINHPEDPRRALQKLRKTVESLSQDPEFKIFQNTPRIFTHIAISHPADPRKALRNLRESPRIFTLIAEICPDTSNKALRNLRKTAESLEKDPAFGSLRDTPWIFMHIAANYHENPRKALLKLLDTIDSLKEEPEFACFQDTPHIFTFIVANNQTDSRMALRKFRHTLDSLKEDPEFESFRDTPWIFMHMAIHYPENPHQALRGLQDAVDSLVKDPLFQTNPELLQRRNIDTPLNGMSDFIKYHARKRLLHDKIPSDSPTRRAKPVDLTGRPPGSNSQCPGALS